MLQRVFIMQCRVDPLINGDAEHYLRTQIPNWLTVANTKKVFYINTLINGNLYKTEMTSDYIYTVVNNFFKNLLKHEDLNNFKLVFCPTASPLIKGLTTIKGFVPLPRPKIEKIFKNFKPDTEKHLIANLRDKFPKQFRKEFPTKEKSFDSNPTHIIKNNIGYKISQDPVVFSRDSLTISIYKKDERSYMQPHNSFVFLNGELQNSEVQIVVGDLIKFPTESTYLKAVKVEDD